VIDTGGFDPNPDDPLLRLMRDQVEIAIREADLVLFLTDFKSGLSPVDQEIARMLLGCGRPVLCVVNKVDSYDKEAPAAEFYALGAEDLHLISAAHGSGVHALLERAFSLLPRDAGLGGEGEGDQQGVTRVAVVGRPNVGKSTLINRLLGTTRLLTSEQPGTTRDAVDTLWEGPGGERLVLVDTAGIRRKRAVRDAVEYYSVVRAVRSIERAHIVVLLADATLGFDAQEAKIAALIEERGRAFAVAFNKWDLVEKDGETADRYRKRLVQEYPFLSFVPVAFLSARTGRGAARLIALAAELKQSWEKRVPTAELNRFVGGLTAHLPPSAGGRHGRIYYAAQVQAGPPTFLFHVNLPAAFTVSYKRYLENRLREEFGFAGTPIRLVFRQRSEGRGER